jgi:hypothetical protein
VSAGSTPGQTRRGRTGIVESSQVGSRLNEARLEQTTPDQKILFGSGLVEARWVGKFDTRPNEERPDGTSRVWSRKLGSCQDGSRGDQTRPDQTRRFGSVLVVSRREGSAESTTSQTRAKLDGTSRVENRPDQTRPHQARPEQTRRGDETRPDETRPDKTRRDETRLD